MSSFVHLHLHTQYSILDGACNIQGLMKKAEAWEMPAVAITDHGNMFGAKDFWNTARKTGVKPILGVEAYIAKRSMAEREEKMDRSGDHIILLAKNKNGYANLVKIVSASWTEGFYYKPRIDKELLRTHSEGLIATSACIAGEIAQSVLQDNLPRAEEILKEYRDIFGDDFYLEIQRHETHDPNADREVFPQQEKVIRAYRSLSQKTGVKLVASNDVHFLNAEDAEAHDRLICLNTGKDLDDEDRLKYTKQEYFKSPQEMQEIFADIPEAIENTLEIAAKVEEYDLNHDPIMPEFDLPEGFTDKDEYLRHLTYEGAKDRWGEITDEIRERLDFELETIKNMGFPGYFLIVQDFLHAAREMGVSVGPGRGSAAGSAVAYCLQITDIDPIRYNLLFERFLNPDRISMPDIDIDFDEDGRELVLNWVVNKYGAERVAHIITFGTMAAKLAIRDVARIQKLPLQEADLLAKLVPDRPGVSLAQAYEEVPDLKKARESGGELTEQTLKYAETLEGSVRQTGVHACGIIIGKDPLHEYIPICRAKDTELNVTQYDGNHVEDVGLLKMDFLGLKTLSIIKDAVDNIKLSKGDEVDISHVNLEDEKTFELFSRGETTGLFQFESAGMKKYLRELKPNRFEDLIAMNALYRPGPMEYIPSFVKRKHGQEEINYDLPIMEEYLKDTYGITVYQEQVMLLSQALAGFTKGQADSLRKAMGKKKKALMEKLKVKFLEGCKNNGYEEKIIDKIWHDWEAFAQYAFNKSHSTCYAYVAYQTGWLKAHYPSEFMAAVLSRNISDIKKITLFMDEATRMGISVLGPDVNESHVKFTVNSEGDVRFGMAAIKGVGESAVLQIIEEREANGPFKSIYDFVERVNLNAVNKKSMEALALAGAFDGFGEPARDQYFALNSKDQSFIENLVKYGNTYQTDQATAQQSLFGETADSLLNKPDLPPSPGWSRLETLQKEKEVIGIYLSSHPLDEYKLEIKHFCNANLDDMQEMKAWKGKEMIMAGMVIDAYHGTTKTGKPYGSFTLQDFTATYRFMLFGQDYVNFSKYCRTGFFLLVRGQIQSRKYNEKELECKVKDIHLLSEVKEDLIRSLSVKIPLEVIAEDFIGKLDELIQKHPGNTELKFMVYDTTERISLSLFSRNRRFHPDKEIIRFLEENPAVEFKLN